MVASKKVAMVTGAGQGIGRAIALRLAKAGFALSIADLNLANAQKVAQEINQDGGEAMAVELNVAGRANFRKAVQTTAVQLGGFDVLVNNAGLEPVTKIEDVTPEMFNKVMNVNVAGDMWGFKRPWNNLNRRPVAAKKLSVRLLMRPPKPESVATRMNCFIAVASLPFAALPRLRRGI